MEPADDFGVFLASSEYLSLHAPLTAENHKMFDATTLARMRPDSYLINVSRGGLVDEDDLLDALRNGHLGGAALDVLEDEPPPPDHPLFALDNVLVTAARCLVLGGFAARTQRSVCQRRSRRTRGKVAASHFERSGRVSVARKVSHPECTRTLVTGRARCIPCALNGAYRTSSGGGFGGSLLGGAE